jgi:hypothetical protein
VSAQSHNEDILVKRKHLIIFADGVSKELINAKQPVINSWRPQMLEVRNMCKIIECNYNYPTATNFPNRFVSNKCYIENDYYCETQTEKNSIFKIEEIIHESDFSTKINLGDEWFGIIANSKNEDAIIFEIGDPVTLEDMEKEKKKI